MKVFSKKYICVKQYDITDCGAACLATISKQHGLKLSISKIREIAGTDRQGTNAYGVVKAAKELGFSAKAVKALPEHLENELILPCIAHVVMDEQLLHYVVIHEINKTEIIVADPGQGIIRYKKEDFLKIWTGILIFLVPEESFKKRDETTGLFKRFFSLLLPHKNLMVHIFISSVIYTILGLVGAFYFKFLIDDILSNSLKNTLMVFSIGMFLLNAFEVVINAFRQHILLHLGQKINVSLITKYYSHVLELPMNFFDSRKVGEILSRLNDAGKIMQAISGATLTVMIDVLMLIVAGIVLSIQNTSLFLVALIFIPVHIFLAWAFVKPFQNVHRKEMENSADTESYLVESLGGVATIKSVNGEDLAAYETEKRFIKFIRANFKAGWMANLSSFMENLVNSLSNIVILWIGGLQVIKGNISIGQLITFNALFGYFFDPIKRLINLIPSMQEAYVASDRLGEILDLNSEKENESKKVFINKLKGDIEFKNVDFRYGTRELILKNINVSIKAGEKVAIVGESGSGKTTFVKLLLKYYLPIKGDLLIDGHNIQDINIESIRDNIGYVPQDIFLFSGTISENITFGIDNAKAEDIVEAAKKAKAHDFINDLQLRYETVIGERGSTLSGGQKQRISFARTILKNPNMLILDEATSSLDSATEKAIHSTIEHISQGITTIIIAHRLSTIRGCDRIIVMDKGEIIENGSHDELLKLKGKYYELWRNQVDGERF